MKAWVMAQKDLHVFFRDRAAVALGFGLPILLCTVFATAMGAIGGDGGSVGRVELVLEDADRSSASRALVAELQAADGLRLDVLAAEAAGEESKDTARSRVAEGDAPAGLLIGAGYGEALASGGDLPLVLYRDPGKVIEQQILAGNLLPAFFAAMGERLGPRIGAKVLDTFDFPVLGRERAQAILDSSWSSMEALVGELRTRVPDEEEEGDDEAAAIEAENVEADVETGDKDGGDSDSGFDFASGMAELLGLEVEDVVGGDQEAAARKVAQQANAVAGMAVMMLLFGLVACGGTLLEEAHSGTLDRLRLTPGATGAILGGKFVFTALVGLSQLALLFLYGSLVFDVPILRAPLALGVLSAAVAAAVTGFGLLFAVLCRTQKQLEGLSTLVVLTMSALGGSWWPLAITPEWFQKLGHLTLNAWAMDGFQGIFWYGKGLGGILPEIGVLLGIALFTSLAAWRLFERRMRV
ncbi:MAG: ABC transporter permease [Planctomycetes bacterium]|nr:ABC transporter permease [Planctomycetota bacterium]